MTPRRLPSSIYGWMVAACLFAGSLRAAETVDYGRQVKPILVNHCYRCHGPVKQESSLRLDSRARIVEGGEQGAAIVPGDPQSSLLIQAVHRNGDLQMPPEGEPLSDKEIAILTSWIEQGASVAPEDDIEGHWAYRNPQRAALPESTSSAFTNNPIDHFIANQHRQNGLVAVAAAPREILLRRVYLDLIGLPPTPQEITSFVNDAAPDAYERVVRRLLDSPQYGERWGRHWMDVWRYSDWSGYQQEVRESQPHIWRWRDWIVESLNNDAAYDQMILEMLAADELAPTDPDRLRATGFLVRNWYKFNRNTWLEGTVEHTAKAFLGMTIACARCHDHMYDPITQEDYYRFRAFFEPHQIRTDRIPGISDIKLDGVPRVYDADLATSTYLFMRGDERNPDTSRSLMPSLPASFGGEVTIEAVPMPPQVFYPGLLPHVRDEIVAGQQRQLETAHNQLREREEAVRMAEQAGAADGSQVQLDAAKAALGVAQKQLEAAQTALAWTIARVEADRSRYCEPADSTSQQLCEQAARLERQWSVIDAEARTLAAQVEHGKAESALQQQPESEELKKKLGEAKAALTTAEESLTKAKTAVEQFDPTQPSYTPLTEIYPTQSSGRRLALARWIASSENPLTARVAVNHMWLRHFGQPLVTRVDDFGLNSPRPDHADLLDWLAVELMEPGWRMKHIHYLMVTSRLYALQSWADANSSMNLGIDPDNRYYWRMNPRRMEAEVVRDSILYVSGRLDLSRGGPELDHEAGLKTLRRSMYYRHAYEKQMLLMRLFDTASVEECYRRSESIIPQQALALANSPLALASARILAHEIVAQNPGDRTTQIRAAFLQVLGRSASEAEIALCHQFLEKQTSRLANTEQLTRYVASAAGEPEVPPAQTPADRAWENLVHMLLNHNDFITIR